MKIKVGDKVKVIAGKDKGKEGKVIETLKNKDRVIVEKVNMIKKHIKPNGQNEAGGIVETEGSIHVSNVKLVKEDKKSKEKKSTKKETTKKPEKKDNKKVDAKKESNK